MVAKEAEHVRKLNKRTEENLRKRNLLLIDQKIEKVKEESNTHTHTYTKYYLIFLLYCKREKEKENTVETKFLLIDIDIHKALLYHNLLRT